MATTKFYLTRPYESKSGIYAGIPRKEKKEMVKYNIIN